MGPETSALNLDASAAHVSTSLGPTSEEANPLATRISRTTCFPPSLSNADSSRRTVSAAASRSHRSSFSPDADANAATEPRHARLNSAAVAARTALRVARAETGAVATTSAVANATAPKKPNPSASPSSSSVSADFSDPDRANVTAPIKKHANAHDAVAYAERRRKRRMAESSSRE